MSKKRRTKRASSAKKPRPDIKTPVARTAAVHIPQQSSPTTVDPWDVESDGALYGDESTGGVAVDFKFRSAVLPGVLMSFGDLFAKERRREIDLQAPQRSRTDNQPAQEPPGRRHSLRQTRLRLPRHRHHRRDPALAPGLSRPVVSVPDEPQIEVLSVENCLAQGQKLTRERIGDYAWRQARYFRQQGDHLAAVENSVRIRQQMPQHRKLRLVESGQLWPPCQTMLGAGFDRAALATDLHVNHGQILWTA